MKRFDWTVIDDNDIRDFAYRKISGAQFYNKYKNSYVGGKVRNLLRERGVDNARDLARYAYNRIVTK